MPKNGDYYHIDLTPRSILCFKVLTHTLTQTYVRNKKNNRRTDTLDMQLKICATFSREISINKHFSLLFFFFLFISYPHLNVPFPGYVCTELPRTKPKIADINNTKYRVGDALYGNCTSYNSKPAANLTWLINNVTVSVFVHCSRVSFISSFFCPRNKCLRKQIY